VSGAQRARSSTAWAVSIVRTATIAPLVPNEDAASPRNDAARPVRSIALGVMPYAVDLEAAVRLWTLSEQLLGLM